MDWNGVGNGVGNGRRGGGGGEGGGSLSFPMFAVIYIPFTSIYPSIGTLG